MSRALTLLCLPLFTWSVPASAQDIELSPGERAVQAQELHLQEQRAVTLRTRLLLYTDELQKLRARYAADKNDGAAEAVDKEVASIQKSIKTLSASALERLEGDPPLPLDNTAPRPSAAKVISGRVEGVMRQFEEASRDAVLASAAQSKGRTRILKIEDARKGEKGSNYKDGRDYWYYKDSSATWTINDLQPGVYDVQLRYSAGEGGGGATMSIKAAGQTLTVNIPAGTSGGRPLSIDVTGQFKITDPAVDLRVTGVKRREDANYYWDLQEVVLRPAGLVRPKSP